MVARDGNSAQDDLKRFRRVIRFQDLPYDPFRTALYTVRELMAGYRPGVPASSRDEIIAQYFKDHNKGIPDVHDALAQRIHDHGIDMALYRFAKPRGKERRKIIGVMGSHSTQRTESRFVSIAKVTWQLRQEGFAIVSGGGPGIMEAANLGAYLSEYPMESVDQALEMLAKSPDYEKQPQAYIAAATAVRKRFPKDSGESLAIPTWSYPDEPTGQFSSRIGKYFANSIREDGLLAIAADGIIFAPGSAGTLQEVFQDTAHNSYWTFQTRAPMVFFDDQGFYTSEPSVFNVVKSRATKDGYGDLVAAYSAMDDIVGFIKANPMKTHPAPAAQRTFGLSNLSLV